MVLPLSAGYTVRPFTSAMNSAVCDAGRTLPPVVAPSFTCDTITEAGRTSSLAA